MNAAVDILLWIYLDIDPLYRSSCTCTYHIHVVVL